MNQHAKRVALIGAVALAVLAGGAVLGRPQPSAGPAPTPVADAAPVDQLADRIRSTQDRLREVPGDWTAWAGLGLAYLEQSRVTSDPTYYPKAEQAVARSLSVRPKDNEAALVARGAIANARHDFVAARRDALAVIRVNPYQADAYAVLADAETQLGHPSAATRAVQRLLDLRPGLPAYARASYDLELRGLTEPATALMRQALDAAVDGHDVAFCHVHLGELALNAGDLDTAAAHYSAARSADPHSIAARHGQARIAAAQGRLADALAGFAALTLRAPIPGYLLEYADLLASAGRDREARQQRELAATAHELFTASGGTDGLTGAAIALAQDRPAEAVRMARDEWKRRQHADVADMLGWALHRAGDDREAIRYARLAVTSGARSAPYAYHLGMISLGLGDRSTAVAQLTRALDLNPTFSPVDAPVARRTLTSLGA